MRKFTDILWPTLEKSSRAEAVAAQRSSGILADIERIAPRKAGSVAILLEEARRLTDDEKATRTTVETRGGIYLAAIGTLVPIVTFVAGAVAENDSSALTMLKIVLSLISTAYLFGASIWSFRSLSVRTYRRVGVSDIPCIAGDRDPDLKLAKSLLEAVLENRTVVNTKVDAIRMAEIFLLRAVFFLLILLAAAQLPHGFLENVFPRRVEGFMYCNNSIEVAVVEFGVCRILPAI